MSSAANLARLAFRLPEALDPGGSTLNAPDRIRVAIELLEAALAGANSARSLSPEGRWGRLVEVHDLTVLAQRQLFGVTEELRSIEEARERLEALKKAG
jgi:hypothetical protein